MAEINSNHQQQQGKKPRAKKHSTRMDMTPMVDLAFLLLTFFMLTTTFNKANTLVLNVPHPGPPGPVPDNTVTILVGKNNQLVYYQGMFNPKDVAGFHSTNYSYNGIRKELMDLNQPLIDKIAAIEADYKNKLFNDSIYQLKINEEKKKRDNHGIFVIIKATDEARYENLVLLLDEMKICDVVNYAIVDITKEEEKLMATL
jgi:biopolymer transport protein ExbD